MTDKIAASIEDLRDSIATASLSLSEVAKTLKTAGLTPEQTKTALETLAKTSEPPYESISGSTSNLCQETVVIQRRVP